MECATGSASASSNLRTLLLTGINMMDRIHARFLIMSILSILSEKVRRSACVTCRLHQSRVVLTSCFAIESQTTSR